MKKIDILLVGAPVAIGIGAFVKSGDWFNLALPAAILLVVPLIIWRARFERQGER